MFSWNDVCGGCVCCLCVLAGCLSVVVGSWLAGGGDARLLECCD